MQKDPKLCKQFKNTSSTNTHFQMRSDLRCFFFPLKDKGTQTWSGIFSFQGPQFQGKHLFPRLVAISEKKVGGFYLASSPARTHCKGVIVKKMNIYQTILILIMMMISGRIGCEFKEVVVSCSHLFNSLSWSGIPWQPNW